MVIKSDSLDVISTTPISSGLQDAICLSKEQLSAERGVLIYFSSCKARIIFDTQAGGDASTPDFDFSRVFEASFSFKLSELNYPCDTERLPHELKIWLREHFTVEEALLVSRHSFHEDSLMLVLLGNEVRYSNAQPRNLLSLIVPWVNSELNHHIERVASVKLRTLFDKLQTVANIGTWEVDVVNNRLSWSSQTKVIHEVGEDFEPQLSTAINFYKEGYSRDKITQIVTTAIEHGKPWTTVLELVTAKGNTVWVESNGMVEMVDGQCVRLFGTFQNVHKTETQRLELKQRKTELESAYKERGDLLSRISHELRTPLNGIIGMLQALKSEQREHIRDRKTEFALASADRLLELINDVLDYTDISDGHFTLHYSDFSLSSLINELATTFESQCQDKGLGFTLTHNLTDSDYFYSDPARLEQIFTNLLSNAVKFTEQGRVTFNIALDKTNEGEVLIATVEDTGIGISQRIRENIFKPLLNNQGLISAKDSGTGLGLSIVKQLVDKFDGKIEVSSEEGEGATFGISLPLVRSDITTSVLSGDDTLPSKLLDTPLSILVVDDNDINRVVLLSMLEKYNYQADEAEDGEVAIARARSKRYDLIFMDCAMPVLDGVSATRVILEENLLTKYGCVVAVTANTSEEDKAACIKAGMRAFLAKPIVQKDVTGVLRWVLQHKSQG